jgi:translation initiation factor 1
VLDPKAQPVRVRREKRGGKMVTVAAGFAPRSPKTDDLPAMLAELKKSLATGGKAVEDGFELQGDHRDRIVAWLIERGYPAKPAGG